MIATPTKSFSTNPKELICLHQLRTLPALFENGKLLAKSQIF
jgi:hypothetical protein